MIVCGLSVSFGLACRDPCVGEVDDGGVPSDTASRRGRGAVGERGQEFTFGAGAAGVEALDYASAAVVVAVARAGPPPPGSDLGAGDLAPGAQGQRRPGHGQW